MFGASATSIGVWKSELGSDPASAGTAPLQIGTASIAGPGAASFAIAPGGDGCSGRTIAPGASCAVAVAFSPRAAGALTATLQIPGDAPASVPLAGSGVEPLSPPPSPPPPPPPPGETAPRAALLQHQGPYVVRGGKRIQVRLRCEPGGTVCRTKLKLLRGGRRELAPRRKLRASLRIVTSGRRTAVVRIAYRLDNTPAGMAG